MYVCMYVCERESKRERERPAQTLVVVFAVKCVLYPLNSTSVASEKREGRQRQKRERPP